MLKLQNTYIVVWVISWSLGQFSFIRNAVNIYHLDLIRGNEIFLETQKKNPDHLSVTEVWSSRKFSVLIKSREAKIQSSRDYITLEAFSRESSYAW